MRVLLVGSGGREHALAWKLSQSPELERLFVAPGNGGTARVPKAENVAIGAADLQALRAFALAERIDLTVVGPEEPLVLGIVDEFQGAGLRVFGPTRAAAQLEGSKAFAKAFMQEAGIPAAASESFDNYRDAIKHVMLAKELPVIKVSGLAAGKGVFVPTCFNDAETALHIIFVEQRFGAGQSVVIEERLEGPELSVLAFCDGESYRLMPAAQDHKRLRDGDEGPNTGGMGAFAPSPLTTPELLAEIEERVIRPTLERMAARGTPYVGVLYAGLMLTTQGPKVLEFNCRFGDPETQVIMPLLESDLLEVMLACVEGRLGEQHLRWRDGAAATVVMAAGGYPELYEKGYRIEGLDEAAEVPGVIPFQAGTALADNSVVTAGGRVLSVTGIADVLPEAIEHAYAGVEQIHFEGAFYRRDIGNAVRASLPKTDIASEPFIGIWQDREDMQDSTAWVHDLRRSEWERHE
jgi:phosphoribosylamine--glycine ligase